MSISSTATAEAADEPIAQPVPETAGKASFFHASTSDDPTLISGGGIAVFQQAVLNMQRMAENDGEQDRPASASEINALKTLIENLMKSEGAGNYLSELIKLDTALTDHLSASMLKYVSGQVETIQNHIDNNGNTNNNAVSGRESDMQNLWAGLEEQNRQIDRDFALLDRYLSPEQREALRLAQENIDHAQTTEDRIHAQAAEAAIQNQIATDVHDRAIANNDRTTANIADHAQDSTQNEITSINDFFAADAPHVERSAPAADPHAQGANNTSPSLNLASAPPLDMSTGQSPCGLEHTELGDAHLGLASVSHDGDPQPVASSQTLSVAPPPPTLTLVPGH